MNPQSKITEIVVGLGERSYPIQVGAKLLDEIGPLAASMDFRSPVVIISDDRVAPLYAQRVQTSLERSGLRGELLVFPAGETSKHLGTVSHLYDGMVRVNPERKSGVIALGGGVAGDIAGFVAATYLRGIPFIQAPTTLLAQVDASVGGKVGVDHAGGKNLIGAFYQPKAVIIDVETLNTLSSRERLAGLAEVIKHGVIADAQLFERTRRALSGLLASDLELFEEIIPWNCRIKASVVEQDEKESGLRAILNFGHTIGHAIEALTGYETYLHGEAVAIGMALEAELGLRLGVTPRDAVVSLRALIEDAGFSLAKPNIDAQDLVESMYRDKKVEDRTIRFILPTRIGDVTIRPVNEIHLIEELWDSFHWA